jgi:dihydroorotate dehydrogenase (NAD+) catalytic subunit
MADLSVEFCGVKFRNPLVLASGVLGVTGDSLRYVIECGAGGVTSKSVWLEPHKGHSNPTMIANEHWFMNAVGLPDGGLEKAMDELGGFIKTGEAPLIVNIVGGKKADFLAIAERIGEIKPELIEVNMSCPNVENEFGKPFACSVLDAADLTREVKKFFPSIPVAVKLSPNVPNIGEIAKACADAGADGITAINTVGPGMAIDIDMRAPILANKVGGLSGPAIQPIALKCVNDIYKAVSIPIIATGGVITGRDAIAMMMAGGTLVGVGSAVYYRGSEVFGKIAKEMSEWCDENGVKDLTEIIGCVPKNY